MSRENHGNTDTELTSAKRTKLTVADLQAANIDEKLIQWSGLLTPAKGRIRQTFFNPPYKAVADNIYNVLFPLQS